MESDAHKRVLYVEDDSLSAEMMEAWLECGNKHIDLTVVSDAESAMHWIHSGRFDLYLLDYCLPAVTGAELCEAIRRVDMERPVIFFSALSRHVDRKKAMAAGANFFFVKPDDLDTLKHTVWQLLSAREDGARNAPRRVRRASNIV